MEDNVRWQREMFTPGVNTLIGDILQLGGEAELTRTFAQFRKEFEPALQQIRDRLMAVAMDRGLET
jgi:hypothetical protein